MKFSAKEEMIDQMLFWMVVIKKFLRKRMKERDCYILTRQQLAQSNAACEIETFLLTHPGIPITTPHAEHKSGMMLRDCRVKFPQDAGKSEEYTDSYKEMRELMLTFDDYLGFAYIVVYTS